MNTSQYFYRCVAFTRENGKVALADIYNPSQTSELEEWFGIVISLADGAHTIKELIEYMGSRYESAPDNLEETICSVMDRLIEGNMIKLHDTKIDMPYYLAYHIEQLDIETAKQHMEKDGYVYH